MALLRQCLFELRAAQARAQADLPRKPMHTLMHERPATSVHALVPVSSQPLDANHAGIKSASSFPR